MRLITQFTTFQPVSSEHLTRQFKNENGFIKQGAAMRIKAALDLPGASKDVDLSAFTMDNWWHSDRLS